MARSLARPFAAALLAAAFLGSDALAGPSAAAQEGVEPPHRRVVSLNPVAFLAFGFLSVDYEQVLTGNTSAGGAGSYFRRGDAHFFTVDGRARYYFHGTVLDGFSVGVLAGAVSRRDRVEDTSTTGLGLGFVVEHQWLLGDDRRLAIAAGGGAQRLIYFGDRPGRSVLPVIRLSLGWAF